MSAVVVDWLTSQGWECYTEVEFTHKLGRADIVAIKPGTVWIIESKLTLNLDLLDQVIDWTDTAHFVSLAVPNPTKQKIARHGAAVRCVTDHYGIGILYCLKNAKSIVVQEYKEPKRNENVNGAADKVRDVCVAGISITTKDGVSWKRAKSPYRATIEAAAEYLERNGPVSLSVLVKNIKHHYKTEMSAINNLRMAFSKWEKDKFFLDTTKKPNVVILLK